MYSLCDSHCHLESMKQYSPLQHPQLLHITCGYSPASNAANFEIASENKNVFCCLGIAPQEAMKFKNPQAEIARAESEISAFFSRSQGKVVAVGEIGLDYHWAKTAQEREKQMQCFLSMLGLAEKLCLPAVIHSRNSMDEVISALEAHAPRGIMMHCYSGTKEQTQKLLSMGALLSLPPMRSKERKQAIKLAGIHNVACETDAPYIGKSPLDALQSAQMVADALSAALSQVQERATKNAMEFFGIKG